MAPRHRGSDAHARLLVPACASPLGPRCCRYAALAHWEEEEAAEEQVGGRLVGSSAAAMPLSGCSLPLLLRRVFLGDELRVYSESEAS